jgi:predicted nucleic acid-binding protein
MSDIVFVDTNILIYAHDSDAASKRERAVESLRILWETGMGRISVQVLQEFYVNATRKIAKPLARSVAREVINSYGAWIRDPTTAGTVLRASDIAEMAQISFWDALILASAEQAGAAQLFSEDLNRGQSIVGIQIINPLIPA